MRLRNLIKETIRGWLYKRKHIINTALEYEFIVKQTVPYEDDKDWWEIRVRILVSSGGSLRKF